MEQSRHAYEIAVLAQIRAGVLLSIDAARSAPLDDAILRVIRRDFSAAIDAFGFVETAASIERLLSSGPTKPHSQRFFAAVQAEFNRRNLKVAA